MEHIFVEAQMYSEIFIPEEQHIFDIQPSYTDQHVLIH